MFKRISFWAWRSGTETCAFSFVLLSEAVSRLAVREVWLQVIITARKYIISCIDSGMWEYFKCLFILYKINKLDLKLCQLHVNKNFRRIPVWSQGRPVLGWRAFMHYSIAFLPDIIFCFYNILMKFDICSSYNLARTTVYWRFTSDLSNVYVCVWDVREQKTILGRTMAQIVACLFLLRPGFDSGPALLGFVVAEVTLRL